MITQKVLDLTLLLIVIGIPVVLMWLFVHFY